MVLLLLALGCADPSGTDSDGDTADTGSIDTADTADTAAEEPEDTDTAPGGWEAPAGATATTSTPT
jgi:hypothetical protein